MKSIENIENNKLIAEFMGGVLHTPKNINYEPYFRFVRDDGTIKRDAIISKLYYSSDWNWLMEVVDKINEQDDHVKQFAGMSIFELGLGADIETVYEAVIQFIKWHNSNPK